MAHLRLEDWTRIDLVDELDLVGPVAVEGLRRHGLMFPANTHFIVPMARAAAGGSLLTGVGGDDVFGTWQWQDVGSLFAGRRGPRLGDAKRLAHAFAPRRLRGEVLRRRLPLRLPWLRPEVRSQAGLRIAVEMSAPQTWSARMLWSARWRPWRATARNLALLAADHGATVGSPFLEPAFLAALAGAGGRWGWGGRADTMRALFGDLVPEWLISRRGKAEFSEPLFGTHTRRFAQEWDGRSGLDPSLVDGEVLKAVWCAHQPHFLSAMAAQAAWLATYGEAGTRADARTGALLSAP
jgi:asparagine synthase (glutamine-hydrolysing)